MSVEAGGRYGFSLSRMLVLESNGHDIVKDGAWPSGQSSQLRLHKNFSRSWHGSLSQ
jgi:hypothetical protein